MDTNGFYVMQSQPSLVLAVSDGFLMSMLHTMKEFHFSRQVDVLVFLSWNHEPWHKAIKKYLQTLRLGQVHLHWMTDTLKEQERFLQFGLSAAHCPPSIWIDENIYPLARTPLQQRDFDALYIAGRLPYKRLWLAQDIKRLRIISRPSPPEKSQSLEELGLSMASINNAWIPRTEMHRELANACVGLALSAEEGVMLANVEYLLSGLPVVSTPSRGGRQQYYTDHNHTLVPPDARAIANAAQKWKEVWTPALAQQIRQDALDVQGQFRENFSKYVTSSLGLPSLADFFRRGTEFHLQCHVHSKNLRPGISQLADR